MNQLETANSKLSLSDIPVHFFTIVLNGQPFIRYHIEIFKQLPFKWHWHIVEGVADLKHDTAWSSKLGGKINSNIHNNGLSNDGTTEYINEIKQLYPENITIYRKSQGCFWDGKREMVNAPLANIQEECLLWQVDVDELWTVEQLLTAREMFIKNPEKTAAYYWCWYFVGESLIITSRNCYAENPRQDWLRTWKYKPGYFWVAHEPPILAQPLAQGEWKSVESINPFLHQETEKLGLIFQHFAYTTQEQLEFKEGYYGYKNAVLKWKKLQEQNKFPVLLRDYFAWVGDNTIVDSAQACGVVPIAQKKGNNNNWQFLGTNDLRETQPKIENTFPKILVDGVFFQLYKTGIARVWTSLLEEWAENGFAKHIVVLDRNGTAPKISGMRYWNTPPYDYNKTDVDRKMLQEVCDRENADIFISTYYTTPISTPSVFMCYDMIPEVMKWNLNQQMWREKHYAIRHASAYITISENTSRDLAKIFPNISPNSITVAHCGVKSTFSRPHPQEITAFQIKYGISKPYFLLVGAAGSYKNTILFLQAFAKLPNRNNFEIVCTGACFFSPNEIDQFLSGVAVHYLQLQDEELRLAYAGAVALVYPSKYEGFGLPIVEALACGCPVITCANASIPEVAGQAAIYVKDDDVDELVTALGKVQNPEIRKELITAGLAQAKNFSWSEMAQKVSSVLLKTVESLENTKKIYSQISSQVEQVDRELLEQPIDSPQFLNMLGGCLSLYEIDPFDESVLAELRQLRQRLTDFWLNAATEKLETLYSGNAGKAHQILAESDFKNQALTETEQSFADELTAKLAKETEDGRAKNYRIAAMLYAV